MNYQQPDWFKWNAMQWLSGSIRMHTLEHQGLFANAVSIIWREGGLYRDGIERLAQKAAPVECMRDGAIEHIMALMRDLIDAGLIEQDAAGGLTVKFLTQQLKEIELFRSKQRRNAAQRYTGATVVASVKAAVAANRGDIASEAFTAAKERTLVELDKNNVMLSADDLRVLVKTLRRTYGRVRLSGQSRDAINMGIEAAVCEWRATHAQ